jgi:hypothetical protein
VLVMTWAKRLRLGSPMDEERERAASWVVMGWCELHLGRGSGRAGENGPRGCLGFRILSYFSNLI